VSDGIRVDSRELERGLDALRARASAMPEAHAAVASSLVPGIAQRTPVRSGALAGSWSASGEDGRGVITSDEPYAGVVEFGDPARGIDGARMVRDTIDASERDVLEGYEAGLEREAKRIGFGTT
jgi:hypothetical protein